jgi:hypothetical protein
MVNLSHRLSNITLESSSDDEVTVVDELRIIAALQEALHLLEPHFSVHNDMIDMEERLADIGIDSEVFRGNELSHEPQLVSFRNQLPQEVIHFGSAIQVVNASSWDVERHILDHSTLTSGAGASDHLTVRQVRVRRGAGNSSRPPFSAHSQTARSVRDLCNDAFLLISSTSVGTRILENISTESVVHTGNELRAHAWASDFGSAFFHSSPVPPTVPFTHGGIWAPSVVLIPANLLVFGLRWYNINVVPRVYAPAVFLYTPSVPDLDVYENSPTVWCLGPSLWDAVIGRPQEIELETCHFDCDFVHDLYPCGSFNFSNELFAVNPRENYSRIQEAFVANLVALSALFGGRSVEPDRYIVVSIPHEVELSILAFLSSNMADQVHPGMICDMLSILVEKKIYFQPRRAYHTWWLQFPRYYWRLYSDDTEAHVPLVQTTSALTTVTRAASVNFVSELQFDIRSTSVGMITPWSQCDADDCEEPVSPGSVLCGAINTMPLIPIEFQQLLCQYLWIVLHGDLTSSAYNASCLREAIGYTATSHRVVRYDPLRLMFGVAQGRSGTVTDCGWTQLSRDRDDEFDVVGDYNFDLTFNLSYYRPFQCDSELVQLCMFVVRRRRLSCATPINVSLISKDRMFAWFRSIDCVHVVSLLNSALPGSQSGFKFIADCYSVFKFGILHRHPRVADYVAWCNTVDGDTCTRVVACGGYIPVYQRTISLISQASGSDGTDTSSSRIDRYC